MRELDLTDVRRTPYRLGGREPGKGLDCLGTVLVIAERMGLPVIDAWKQLADAWELGQMDTATGFPDGWARVADARKLAHGDVLLFYGEHPWSAIVCEGYVWSADEHVGSVYSRPLDRWTKPPAEVWRYDPSSRQERTAR